MNCTPIIIESKSNRMAFGKISNQDVHDQSNIDTNVNRDLLAS